jgi:hypothetical protein
MVFTIKDRGFQFQRSLKPLPSQLGLGYDPPWTGSESWGQETTLWGYDWDSGHNMSM